MGTLHWTPQTPQFRTSSASMASQALVGTRSQSAVPGGNSGGALPKRPRRRALSSFSGSRPGLSAEIVAGTRAAQLPKTKREHTAQRRERRAKLPLIRAEAV